MLGDILHFHRTEGAKADMQGYMGDLYTGILYLLQKLFCKVQSCGRSGCASLVFRVYRLVAVLVLQFVCDIRRQDITVPTLHFLPGFTSVSQMSFSFLFKRRISIAASVPTLEP